MKLESGWYWVKPCKVALWTIAQWDEVLQTWAVIKADGIWQDFGQVTIIGPRIEEPK